MFPGVAKVEIRLTAIIHKIRILTVGGLFSGLDEGPAHSHLASGL